MTSILNSVLIPQSIGKFKESSKLTKLADATKILAYSALIGFASMHYQDISKGVEDFYFNSKEKVENSYNNFTAHARNIF